MNTDSSQRRIRLITTAISVAAFAIASVAIAANPSRNPSVDALSAAMAKSGFEAEHPPVRLTTSRGGPDDCDIWELDFKDPVDPHRRIWFRALVFERAETAQEEEAFKSRNPKLQTLKHRKGRLVVEYDAVEGDAPREYAAAWAALQKAVDENG